MAQRPTLRDISAQTGVSTYAVSQALAGKPGVADHTRQRILEVADELGYVPNRIAAGLKSQVSQTVGVMTASGRNQYYSMLVQAIDGALQTAGYHAVTNDAMRAGIYSPELEGESVDQLLQQRVAAIIATYSLSESSLRKIERWGIPVLFVDSLPPAHTPNAPFVGSDNYGGSQKVAEYFAELGFSSVAYLAFPHVWNTREPREAGFVQRCEELGIATQTIECENSVEAAAVSIAAFVAATSDSLPDAVYASNTLLLQGALRAFRDAGLIVPRDISIVAFDEFDWAELLDPPLTVVDQHIDQIGRLAGEAIVKIIVDGSAESNIHLEVESDLILRSSCAPRTR